MSELWMDLAEAITASERTHRDRAEQMWRANDVLAGLRLKGIADGLEMARDHMLRLAAESRARSVGKP
jgi:hypothetical protein